MVSPNYRVSGASDRPEDTGADGRTVVLDDDARVVIKADVGAVLAADFLNGANDDALDNVLLLDVGARRSLLHGSDDDVTDSRIAALGTAKHLDAANLACAGVVGDVQHGLHLNHGSSSEPRPARGAPPIGAADGNRSRRTSLGVLHVVLTWRAR